MKIPVYLHTRFQKTLNNLAHEIKVKVNNSITELEDGTCSDVKKLAPHKDLYRAKIDQGETRIIFCVAKAQTTGEKILIILDLIENDDYYKSVYIRQKIDNSELIPNDFTIENIESSIEFEDKSQKNFDSSGRKIANIVISHNKAIVLTDGQEKVLEKPLPAIIHGAAGSGKTSVALESIRQIVADFKEKGEEERKVAYITLSKNLIQESEKSYWNIEEQEDNNKNQVPQTQVEFLTYDSFLKNQISNEDIKGKKPVDRKVFLSWFKEQSNKEQYKRYKNLGDQIFEEFSAVITGSHIKQKDSNKDFRHKGSSVGSNIRIPRSSSNAFVEYSNDSKNTIIKILKDNYDNRGVRQSIFTKDRDTIFKLYKQWKEYILSNKEYYDSNIIAHKLVHADASKEKIYDKVVVDEAQDLTLVQLELILGSIKNTSDFLLCCDENQVIHPSFFSRNILNAYFHDKVPGKRISEYSLESNYRNSPMVKLLIDGILHVKEKLFPISSKNQSDMQLHGQRTGEKSIPMDSKARYLILTDKHKEEISNTIQTNIKLVVIVLNDNYKEEAKTIFPSLLVFNVHEIKGLEYPHVILFNFFSENKQQYDKILSYIVENSDNNLELNTAESKDKHDKSFEESKLYVNALYVAITRGIETVSIIEEKADIGQRKTLIGYLDEKMHLTQTDDITKILEGNTEDSLSDLKNEAMKLASRGNTEQARTIVCSIREKYIDGNNKENKQEAEKYIKEIEDRIKSDSDKENNQSINYAESDNGKLKTQVNEPWASASHDNSSSTPDHSTGAIPKKRTPIASKLLTSTQNETSTKSSRKAQKKHNKKATTDESKTDPEEMISDLKTEWKKVFTKGCSENKIVDFLKENLENIKKVDQEFMHGNLLHHALKHNNINITQFLIEKKLLDVNAKSYDGATLLHIAVDNGHTEITNLLLKKGADVNAKTGDGRTPLHLAALHRSTEVAELLLKKGADHNAKANNGATPLHIAVDNGHTEVAALLLKKGANRNAKSDNGTTPLHHAAYNGHTEVAALLLKKGADHNAKSDNGTTPLHVAAHNGHIRLVTLLLDKGADHNAKADDGTTPLHYAAYNGHIEVAALLLKKGADHNAKANDGTTPLHYVAYYGHTEITKLLRKYDKGRGDANTALSGGQDKEYEQLIIKVSTQISKDFYEAVKSFWERKIRTEDADKEFRKITQLLDNQKNGGILPDVYHIVGKNNAIILAAKCKDQTLLQLLLNHAVKIRQIQLIKDLLGIKKDDDDDGKLLVDAKYVETLLNGLKNDEQGADKKPNKQIIELLTAAIDNSLPTNTSEADSNLVSKDSDAVESKLYFHGTTENTNSEVEIKMNDNDEPEHMQLAGQGQKWHYTTDNVQLAPSNNSIPKGFYIGEAAGEGDCFF